ncbi:MAG: PilZ domain-containing protein [Mariprofundaceae bacterium]
MPIHIRNLTKPILYKEIFKSLCRDLECEHQTDLMVLAAYSCDESTSKPLTPALQTLFHHGFTIPQVLSALLNCESIRMQRLFKGYSALPVEIQFKNLQDVIHHFNEIQDTALKVGKNYLLQNQNQKNLTNGLADRIDSAKADDSTRHLVLNESLKYWQNTQEMKIYNFYQGIPVYGNCKIIKIQADCIYVKPSSDLIKVFSSNPSHENAYAICADEKDQMAISITDVSLGSLGLKLGDVSPSLLSCRKNLGVRISTIIPVQVKLRDRVIKQVHLLDISSAGLGFLIPDMKDAPCRTGEVIECSFELGNKNIKASGWVRWVVPINNKIRIGMELRANIAIQQALQKEVFNIQRKIIVALNELEVPKNIKAAL